MLQTKLRLLCMLICICLFACTFAGCSAPAHTSATAPSPVPQTTVPGTTVSSGPDTLTIMVCNDPKATGWELDFHKRDLSPVWTNGLSVYLKNRQLEVQWIIVEKDEYSERLAEVLNGTASLMPDAVWLGDLDAVEKVKAAEAGAFTSLDEILPYSDGTAKAFYEHHAFYRRKAQYNGALWWFGEYEYPVYNEEEQSFGSGVPAGLAVRLDWLDPLQLGIPDTIDKLENYLQVCREQDINGNDLQDEVYTAALTDIENTGLNGFYGVPTSHFALNLQTMQVDNPWTSDGTKKMLKTLRRWVELGYIDPDMVGAQSIDPWCSTNRVAAILDSFDAAYSFTNIDVSGLREWTYSIGVIPNKTAHPDSYTARTATNRSDGNAMAFTSALKSKQAAAKLLDLLHSEEFHVMMEWGIEGINYTVIDGKKALICGNIPEEKWETLKYSSATGAPLFSHGILPWIGTEYDLNEYEKNCGHDKSGRTKEVFQAALSEDILYATDSRHLFAIPTPDETKVIDTLEQNYIQTSRELFTAILRGELDVDHQWNSHILPALQEAGMDLLYKTYQARADRVLG